MFQGCFYGYIKGPRIFQEKDQGTINQETYCAYTVLIIYSYIKLIRREGVFLVLMQDGAPSYTVGEIRKELEERGIRVIFQPPYSPNLNSIERVWHIIKNYLQDNYLEYMGYNQLRVAVKDAQEKVGQFKFKDLIKQMHNRY